MKKWFYGVGLALLPITYISLMKLNSEPIEWSVIGFMALIIAPILLFSKKIGAIEKKVNEMTDAEKLKVTAKVVSKVVRKSVGAD